MRKTAIALAAFGLAAAAHADVTIYGKLDAGFRKSIGSEDKEIATSGDSRIGFKGTEDLGNGLTAFFGMEHRFFPDTGVQDGDMFWKGYSKVGLSGAFGSVGLGRQYTAAFLMVQNKVDPFAGDTVAQVRDVAMRVGGITKVRVNNSVAYDFSTNGFKFGATVAEAAGNGTGGTEKPTSFAGSYASGPFFIAAGLENPAGDNDRQWNLAAGYKIGAVDLTAGYADGRTNADVKAKGYALGMNWQVGTADIKAAYGVQRVDGTTTVQKLGLGYHYNLSKRTTIYADVGHDSKATTEKTGYDLGIRHNF
ncbi:porin [Ideonella sp.]|uniref:porin n=1 Tax=Ideonella sp. TaxID=1929293 RepID=UPI002B49AC0E|nr:porin [Ideonella sp.]HJV69657.1 porin [Ideonella sp.]